jgi:serine/threonine protein kinase
MDADQKDREIAERQNPGERLSSEEKAPRVFTANNLPSGVGFPGDSGLSVGETIGDKYRVVKLLGVGASGSVYEAEHKEIGRHVAIKVVHRALATRRDIVARFRIEARICAKIRNPHVGQVYDVGQTARRTW